jgi:two-component system, chemotaxis family, sensor kinase CheA
MPRMNGFGLVEAIRGSTSLRELPIILVTARENEADRQRGLDSGADAYIVKSSFRQEELLDAIGALT